MSADAAARGDVQGAQHPDFSSTPLPPPHRHLQPSGQSDTSYNRMQPDSHSGVATQQSPYANRPRDRSQSPRFAPNLVPAAPMPSHAPPGREISPSPPLHPGMGPMPSHNNYNNNNNNNNAGRDQSQPREMQQAVFHADSDGYRPVPVAGGASGASQPGYAGNAASSPSYTPPGNLSRYGQTAGYGASSHQPEPYASYEDVGASSPFLPYRHPIDSYASYNSQDGLTAAASAPGVAPPAGYPYGPYNDRTPSPSHFSQYNTPYTDSPPQSRVPPREQRDHLDNMVFVDPRSLADDGDDGLGPPEDSKRASRLSFGRTSKNASSTSMNAPPIAAGAIVGREAAGGVLQRAHPSGAYAPVPGGASSNLDVVEKTAWMRDQEAKSRAWKKWLFIGLGVLILLGIAAGTVSGILVSRKNSSGGSSGHGSGNTGNEGDLGINSQQVKGLMNNPNLHKVFPGMAYSPINTQYPGCLTYPPIQNNVTLDMAVLSQVTNIVRLYGTDCNQTQMVLHAIEKLELTDMKIWLGVWLGNNQTTNDRQLAQMYDILDQYGTKYIKGFVIGNEVLFRQDLTLSQLSEVLMSVKQNLTARNIDLPVATSDLGSDWTAQLVEQVDVVMANVHPFFGGVPVNQAAGWTWTFWQQKDVSLTTGLTGKTNIISEVGWPSQGGNDCAPAPSCPDSTSGAVAGIKEMQTFMNDFVCQTLNNGTNYFWFEAFDEPWKIQFDVNGENWEDHWGLFDVNRNLKKGITIPNCGGKTVSNA